MKYGISTLNEGATKTYKTIVGVTGGVIGTVILGLGVFAITQLFLPMVGGLLLLGVLPADIVLTKIGVKNAKVYDVTEEVIELIEYKDEYVRKTYCAAIGNEIVERMGSKVIAIKKDGKYVYFDPKDDPDRKESCEPIQFTNINAMIHDDNQYLNNGRTRSRVIPFNKTKK